MTVANTFFQIADVVVDEERPALVHTEQRPHPCLRHEFLFPPLLLLFLLHSRRAPQNIRAAPFLFVVHIDLACSISCRMLTLLLVLAAGAAAAHGAAATSISPAEPNDFWIGGFCFNVSANCLANLKQETVFDAFTSGTFSIVKSELGWEGRHRPVSVLVALFTTTAGIVHAIITHPYIARFSTTQAPPRQRLSRHCSGFWTRRQPRQRPRR
jgi:hypothetical protein